MIDMLFQLAASLKIDDKQVVYQTVGYLDRFFGNSDYQCESLADCCLTSYSSLFIASKNSEVEPLSLRDIRDHFLNGQFDRTQIVRREYLIRQCINYENEVTYLFDFVMLFMKLWKMSCQQLLMSSQLLVTTYKFVCDVETAVYDFTKSLLIDAECLKYRQSTMVVALISATIEITLR